MNAVPFPLYDDLLREANKSSSIPNLNMMSPLINSLDSVAVEVIMALIWHHTIITNTYIAGKLPYNGKMFNVSSGLMYKLKDLPDILLKILWIYIDGDNIA